MDIISIIKKAETEHSISRADIIELILTESTFLNQEIYAAADRVRHKYVGDEVHLRALIEFSNICKQNCLYCGLRRDNKNIKRYRLDAETIIRFAETAKNCGYKTVVLQSGEDDYFDVDKMTLIIKRIKKLDVAITLSIGEKPRHVYEAYKNAGADRYLLRIETTDKGLYEKLNPQMNWDKRKECLKNLKELGFELGTGCMVGLPGQSMESLAEDILLFKSIGADMVGIGPFIANANTPLGGEPNGVFELSIKIMAVTRLLMPEINIPATTAMESLHPDGRIRALACGANVIMPNVTESEYRKLYQLYPGKIFSDDTPHHYLYYITEKIKSIGRTVSQTCGSSKSYSRVN